jgi:hypothetical protein
MATMEKGFAEFMVLGNHSFGIVRKDRWDLTPCTHARKPTSHPIRCKRIPCTFRCKRLIIHRHAAFLYTFDTILEGTVASGRGKGTTFNVYLPKYGDERVNDPGDCEEAAIGGSERVLFVDGGEALAEMGSAMREEPGCEVVAGTGGHGGPRHTEDGTSGRKGPSGRQSRRKGPFVFHL